MGGRASMGDGRGGVDSREERGVGVGDGESMEDGRGREEGGVGG